MPSRALARRLAAIICAQQEDAAPKYPCSHPRTPENTKMNGKVAKCRTCRQIIERKAQARRRARKGDSA